jgi:release factor glutamine methyltransferase
MLIKDYKTKFLQELSFLNDVQEAESFFYILLEKNHQLSRVDLALQPNLIFTTDDLQAWNLILNQLKQEIPIQYIVGITSFYGLDFLVTKDVLIPRPETEELVEWILEDTATNTENLDVLDVGTGSGCIAISLAKNNSKMAVEAIDISNEALTIAQKNADLNQVTIDFKLNNILELNDLDKKYDIIVSNPPYVRNKEKEQMKNNVLKYEPHLALFVANENPLVFYEKIATLATNGLKENGKLYFEINQYLAQEMTSLLNKIGFKNIELKKDLFGNNRMMKACF